MAGRFRAGEPIPAAYVAAFGAERDRALARLAWPAPTATPAPTAVAASGQ